MISSAASSVVASALTKGPAGTVAYVAELERRTTHAIASMPASVLQTYWNALEMKNPAMAQAILPDGTTHPAAVSRVSPFVPRTTTANSSPVSAQVWSSSPIKQYLRPSNRLEDDDEIDELDSSQLMDTSLHTGQDEEEDAVAGILEAQNVSMVSESSAANDLQHEAEPNNIEREPGLSRSGIGRAPRTPKTGLSYDGLGSSFHGVGTPFSQRPIPTPSRSTLSLACSPGLESPIIVHPQRLFPEAVLSADDYQDFVPQIQENESASDHSHPRPNTPAPADNSQQVSDDASPHIISEGSPHVVNPPERTPSPSRPPAPSSPLTPLPASPEPNLAHESPSRSRSPKTSRRIRPLSSKKKKVQIQSPDGSSSSQQQVGGLTTAASSPSHEQSDGSSDGGAANGRPASKQPDWLDGLEHQEDEKHGTRRTLTINKPGPRDAALTKRASLLDPIRTRSKAYEKKADAVEQKLKKLQDAADLKAIKAGKPLKTISVKTKAPAYDGWDIEGIPDRLRHNCSQEHFQGLEHKAEEAILNDPASTTGVPGLWAKQQRLERTFSFSESGSARTD